MNKYLKLIDLPTNYGIRMKRLSNRIFGEVTRPTAKTSMRVVTLFSEKPLQKRPEIVEYYPRLIETHNLMLKLRYYGLYRDEHEDFREEMTRLRELRGKVKPKPGEGKRSKKL